MEKPLQHRWTVPILVVVGLFIAFVCAVAQAGIPVWHTLVIVLTVIALFAAIAFVGRVLILGFDALVVLFDAFLCWAFPNHRK